MKSKLKNKMTNLMYNNRLKELKVNLSGKYKMIKIFQQMII